MGDAASASESLWCFSAVPKRTCGITEWWVCQSFIQYERSDSMTLWWDGV